ncbi:MAG: hypothetical protein HY865_08190 [Chloroflexi bacterium]|jgi:hypothetical protein|nr:hypothetical protein [Chloroflexota bacterium]
MMDELKYELLTEVLGQVEGELLKLYFQSCDVEVELFEEATSQNITTVTFGRVQVYVKKEDAKRARKLLEEYETKTEN